MIQLVLTIEDDAMLPDLKRAVKMLRGVVGVTVKKEVAGNSEPIKKPWRPFGKPDEEILRENLTFHRKRV